MSTVPVFWQQCLDAFARELSPQQFNTWIRPLAVEGCGAGYRVLAPNRFMLDWVKKHFAARIGELALDADGRPVPITLAASETPAEASETPAEASDVVH